MTLAFFCLGALSLLDELENNVNEQNKKEWIDWIYAQQLVPTESDDANKAVCGFRGSPWSGRPFDPCTVSFFRGGGSIVFCLTFENQKTCEYIHYDSSHIANTYTALLNLLMLGDDLSRVNKSAIIETLRYLQQEDGR